MMGLNDRKTRTIFLSSIFSPTDLPEKTSQVCYCPSVCAVNKALKLSGRKEKTGPIHVVVDRSRFCKSMLLSRLFHNRHQVEVVLRRFVWLDDRLARGSGIVSVSIAKVQRAKLLSG